MPSSSLRCHVGGGARNDFGTDVEASIPCAGPNDATWAALLCADSDGDGKSNGAELERRAGSELEWHFLGVPRALPLKKRSVPPIRADHAAQSLAVEADDVTPRMGTEARRECHKYIQELLRIDVSEDTRHGVVRRHGVPTKRDISASRHEASTLAALPSDQRSSARYGQQDGGTPSSPGSSSISAWCTATVVAPVAKPIEPP